MTHPASSNFHDNVALWFSLFLGAIPFSYLLCWFTFHLPCELHLASNSSPWTLSRSGRPQLSVRTTKWFVQPKYNCSLASTTELGQSDLAISEGLLGARRNSLNRNFIPTFPGWMRNHTILLPVAAWGSPGQSAHSAAYENASCPSLGAANKKRGVNCSYTSFSTKTTFHFHFKDKEFLTAEARRGSITYSTFSGRTCLVTMLLGLQKALFTTVIPVNTWHGVTIMLNQCCSFSAGSSAGLHGRTWFWRWDWSGQRLRLFGS